jgi:Uma2 family endonuclease
MDAVLEPIITSRKFYAYTDQLLAAREAETRARERFFDGLSPNEKAEFINGEKIVHSPVRLEHNDAAGKIYVLLRPFVDARRLGVVGIEKLLISLDRNDYEPDVVFWKREKSDAFTPGQMKFPAPDLIVEVLSDSTESIDRGIKYDDYAAAGVDEYWIVDASTRIVEQYLLQGDHYVLKMKSETGKLVSRAVEGFTADVPAFFGPTP